MTLRQLNVASANLVEQIPGAVFQGGGRRSTTFVIIYQNVRLGPQFSSQAFATLGNLA